MLSVYKCLADKHDGNDTFWMTQEQEQGSDCAFIPMLECLFAISSYTVTFL